MFNVESTNIISAALYIRLSREDDDKLLESESITNQKALLMQYAKENNIKVYDIYIDDGYSGTNFDRPAFKKLINDIELKKVNMVITKDMSRLGRDYIGTGNLIEKYFPEKGVRYIALTDNIDTYLDNGNSDIAPFKAIMNDMYAKDISKKIRASLTAKMKEGKYVGGRAPYGYKKDPNNKNHLIIDKEQAKVVKTIYNLALEGLTFFKIAQKLTSLKIKTPAEYYDFNWCNKYNYKFGQWHSSTIRDILTNRIYTGDLVQHRRVKVNYKVKKVVPNNQSNYIVVQNTHEAIIDKETFAKVQKLIPKSVGRIEKKEHHLLDGLLYCGDCGHRISVGPRKKSNNLCYTVCNYYRTYRKQKLCTGHCNNYDNLEKEVLKILKNICKKYIDKNKITESVNNKIKSNKNSNKNEITNLKNKIENINKSLDELYFDKLNKVIDEERFFRIKEKLEMNLKQLQSEYNNLITKKKKEINPIEKQQSIDKYIDNFLKLKNPSRDLIVNLIDRIEIFENKTININLTFNNSNKNML